MSRQKSFNNSSGDLSTIIGQDAELEGQLKVKASMRIDGQVKGELEAADTVTIGSEGNINGNISARDIIVGGRVTGSLNASGKIVLESESKLDGDLKANRLIIEEGAIFNGNSNMRGEKPAAKPGKPSQIVLTED